METLLSPATEDQLNPPNSEEKMADVPSDANAHCPGVRSDVAGKDAACAGCPNQQICSSGVTNQPDPGIDFVRARLATVKHKLLILSGKGGVGKSTMTTLLARFLATKDADKQIAVCDIDICGPSMPRMLGAIGEEVHQSGSGWSPVYIDDNLSLISIGFLIGSEDAVIWRGPKKNAMVRQFLADVDWGELEFLLIDTPPGTSDEHLSATTYLCQAGLTGAVIVTTPQEASLLDVRKIIDFCRKMNVPILGVVENMATFSCPRCKVESVLFRATTGGAEKMCSDLNVQFLGSLPLDPKVVRSCDEGENFVQLYPDSPTTVALRSIVEGNIR